ncbi:MAG: DNA cytosine methyltransferase [Chroococcidiopsis sp.]
MLPRPRINWVRSILLPRLQKIFQTKVRRIQANINKAMLKCLDLFSGIGGFTRAGDSLGGIVTTQFVENDANAQRVLRSHWADIPIHSDIRDYHPKKANFDLATIGFPCTNTSSAGNRTGINGEFSSLWFEALRVIIECRPKFVVVENPEGLLVRGARECLASLRMAGYSFDNPQLVSAKELGATHNRARVFIVSYANEWLENAQLPCCWSDQMRNLVSSELAINRFPMFESADDGAAIRFPPGLDEVPVGVTRGATGRIKSRYLFGRTVCPAQAAVALRRVKYLAGIDN